MDERSQELVVLKLVLDHVYESGEWPRLQELHRRIYRDLRADFDVRKVAARLAPSTWAHSWTLQEQLILPASAFREVPEAAPILDALVKLVRYAVDCYRASTDDVEVTEKEVAGVLDIDDAELRLLPLVAWREPLIAKGQRRDDDGWVLEISDEIVQLAAVSDVEGYLAFQDALKAADTEEQTAMAKAHDEMIEATSPRTIQTMSGSDLETSTEPQLADTRSFFLRHRAGVVSFALAVLASLVATLIWSLLQDETPLPSARRDSTPSVEPHSLDRYRLTLPDVQGADTRGSGWVDVTDEQVISFDRDEPCGRAPRPLPRLETAAAFQRGTSQFVLQAIGDFDGKDAKAYFESLERSVSSCATWRATEFGTEVTKRIEIRSVPQVADEALRVLVETTSGEIGFPVYRIDNVYLREGDIVVNVGQLVSIAPPSEALTQELVAIVAEKL